MKGVPIFDKTLLPTCLLEFSVVADTHFKLPPASARTVEFASHAKQGGRHATAFRIAASLNAPVIHMGDMCQEYPETPDFEKATRVALKQVAASGLEKVYYVMGNHDVGDKYDPTVPTGYVNEEKLEKFQKTYGAGWYSFELNGCVFIVLNALVINSALRQAAEQKQWLEQELQRREGKRIFMFLHLPPYLHDEHEHSIGHYENINEPGRSWLLSLVRKYRIDTLIAAHAHFAFYDRIGETRYLVANSTTFTRTGFPLVFCGTPPPDHGRDDMPKLGIYLFRVMQDRTDIHFLRTGGIEHIDSLNKTGESRVIGRVSASVPESPLGITFATALANVVDLPIAWPAVVREKVRNDYPLMTCLEMGIAHARVALSDLSDTLQKLRIALIRKEGVKITVMVLWHPGLDPAKLAELHDDQVDCWEVMMPRSPWPTELSARFILSLRSASKNSVTISTITAREKTEKYWFPQHRYGYWPNELERLIHVLNSLRCEVDGIVCGVDAEASPLETVERVCSKQSIERIANLDFLVQLDSLDDRTNANRVAEGLAAAWSAKRTRIFFEPLTDLDRTQRVCNGILDTLCNPRPAFEILKCMNTVFAGFHRNLEKPTINMNDTNAGRILIISLSSQRVVLLMPIENNDALSSMIEEVIPANVDEDMQIQMYRLSAGTMRSSTVGQLRQVASTISWDGPAILIMAL